MDKKGKGIKFGFILMGLVGLGLAGDNSGSDLSSNTDDYGYGDHTGKPRGYDYGDSGNRGDRGDWDGVKHRISSSGQTWQSGTPVLPSYV